MNRLIKRVRDLGFSIKFSFDLLWKGEKKAFLYIFILSLIELIHPFLLVLFPKYLFDNLIQKNIKHSVLVIIIFVFSRFLLNLAAELVTKKKEMTFYRYKYFLENLLLEKITELRFEQIEATENLEQYDFSKKCIDKGSIEVFIKGFLTIINSCFILAGLLFVLREIPFWMLGLISIVIIINTVGNVKRSCYSYQAMTEETPTERSLYYFRGRLMNREYAKEIRLFSLQNFITKKTKQYIEDFYNISRKYDRKHNKVFWWVSLAEGVQLFSLYFYNVLLFWKNKISLGSFTMNLSAVFQFSSSVNQIVSAFISMAEHGIYIQQYYSFICKESDCKGKETITLGQNYIIEFQDVWFQYPGQNSYVLQGVNTKIHSGEKISIVGTNGAGKSTFIKLLLRLYQPTKGKILLNGTDVEHYELKSYLKLFSAVMQDYQMYSFTILENISWKMELSDKEYSRVNQAVKDMGMEEVISKLEHGLHSYLTQRYDARGIELSGGEHQKLAIVRAIFRNSPIMILDEPTSALSPQSEYDIYQQFSKITSDKTVLYISHRMSSCLLCDKVLVFHQGKLTEEGTHQQLIKQGKLYATMYGKQSSLYG